jgi:hypothetical protein
MSVVQTDLRINPIAAARNISYAPSPGITAIDVQHAIETASSSPAAVIPKSVTFAMSPYTVQPTDYLLEVDTSGGPVSIQMGASGARSGRPVTIKDITGNASTNAISVLRSGAETIDGLTTYPMSSDFMSLTFTPNLAGNGYEVSA